MPSILGHRFDTNIIPHINYLEITDVGEVFNAYPRYLTLSLSKNITPKITYLKSINIEHPGKLIKKYPYLLALNLKTAIKPKIKILKSKKLVEPPEIIEVFPAILSYKTKDEFLPTIDIYLKLEKKNAAFEHNKLKALFLSNLSILQTLLSYSLM